MQETFKGENIHKFRGFVVICKSFLPEIDGVTSFDGATSKQTVKAFFCENLISAKSRKFSTPKVSQYMSNGVPKLHSYSTSVAQLATAHVATKP